jgi:hypothetical protein
MTTTVLKTIGQCAWLVFMVALIVVFIRRKRAGLWKRPRTFPIAMTLLGLALVSYSAAMVLSYFGK